MLKPLNLKLCHTVFLKLLERIQIPDTKLHFRGKHADRCLKRTRLKLKFIRIDLVFDFFFIYTVKERLKSIYHQLSSVTNL